MQQRAARRDALDHALRACAISGRSDSGAPDFDEIAACHLAFLAARQAGDFAAVIEANQILAAECGDYLPRFESIGETALAASFTSRRAACTVASAALYGLNLACEVSVR